MVDKVQGIEVQLSDGTTYPGRVLQYDPVMDLALVKVEPARPLRSIAIGTSADLMVGETVITIGNAFGYENTVSVGIISALHRDVTLSDEQVYRNLIQTDASINPGNSGGPLINVNGELIGINVAVRAGAQGIGFALPIDEVKKGRRRDAEHAADRLDLARPGGRRPATRDAADRGDHGGPAGKPGGVGRIQDGRRAGAGGRAGRRQHARPGARAAGLSARPADEADDPPGRCRAVAGPGREAAAPGMSVVASSEPGDLVWEILGLKTMPVSTDWVSAVSPKLRGGLYIEAVLPGSPAAQAAIQKGDILVGMNVGTRHWETIRPDNILYVLRQPEAVQTQGAVLYLVRHNGSSSHAGSAWPRRESRRSSVSDRKSECEFAPAHRSPDDHGMRVDPAPATPPGP